MSCFALNFRADFVNKDDRDTARLALHGQRVSWDGCTVGSLSCSYKTDDTSLGVEILLDIDKLPLNKEPV